VFILFQNVCQAYTIMGCAGLCLCPGPEIWIGPWDIPTFPLPPTRKLMQRQKAAQCARQRVGPKSTSSILTHQVNTNEVTNHPYLMNLKLLTKLLTYNPYPHTSTSVLTLGFMLRPGFKPGLPIPHPPVDV
jgi:hypothetical protein